MFPFEHGSFSCKSSLKPIHWYYQSLLLPYSLTSPLWIVTSRSWAHRRQRSRSYREVHIGRYRWSTSWNFAISHGYVRNNQRLNMVPMTNPWRDDNFYRACPDMLGKVRSGTNLRRYPSLKPTFPKWCYVLLFLGLTTWSLPRSHGLNKAALDSGEAQVRQDTPESCCLRSRTTLW